MSLDRDTFFIDGEWAAPAGGELLEVVSPHTEEVVATVPEGTMADIDAAVAAARRAFDEGPWPRMSPRSGSTSSRPSPASTPPGWARWPT